MAENPIAVSAEKAFDSQSRDALLIKFSSRPFEANVYVAIAQLGNLLSFFQAETESCQAGESAKDLAHWVREADGTVYLLIGHDVDTWDIGIRMDRAVVDDLLAEIQAILPDLS